MKLKPTFIEAREVYDFKRGVFLFKSENMTLLAESHDTHYMSGQKPDMPKNMFLFRSKSGNFWLQEDFYNDYAGESLYETELDILSIDEAMDIFCKCHIAHTKFLDIFPDVEVKEA